MREKVIRGFVSSVIVLLLLCFEYRLSFGIVHDFEAENTVYTIEDFYQINDYDVEGDRLVPTGGDPQLIMSFDGSVASEVSVFLSEAGGTDVKGQLYFYGKSGFSEKNSMPLNLDAGQTKFTWSMDKRNIGFLRIDWDGEVSLDHIEVTSQIAHISIAKAAVFSIVCLFVDLLIWLLLYKKIKQICQTAKAFLDKGDRALLAFGRRIRINISVFFAGFALIGGLVYSFIIPIGMVPDEPIHISLMCNALGVTGLSEQYYSLLDEGHILDRVRDAKLDVDRTLYREVSQIKFDKSQISFSFDIKKNVVGYIPCGIGFWLGYLLNLPIVWCTQLGEISALLFFVAVGYMALKIMPVYKEALCAIMLIPMNLQQCASFNYDSVLLPLCYLLAAYMMYLRFEKDRLDIKSYVVMFVLAAIIAVIKIPYILLLAMYFAIPDSKKPYHLAKRTKIILAAVIICLGIAGVWVLRNVSMIYVILAALMEPGQTFRIFVSTFGQFGWYYMQTMIGCFGWLDCTVPNWFVIFSLVSIFGFAQIKQKETVHTKAWDRGLLILISCAVIVLIVISMLQWYMNYLGINTYSMEAFRQGMYNVSVVSGVQGRYWLPFVPCLAVAFSGIVPNQKSRLIIWQCCYYVIAAVVPVYELACRYWI